jgi:hypothetical protein
VEVLFRDPYHCWSDRLARQVKLKEATGMKKWISVLSILMLVAAFQGVALAEGGK